MSARDRLPLLAVLWLLTAAAAGLLFAWLLRPLPEGKEGRFVLRDREAGVEEGGVPGTGPRTAGRTGVRAAPGGASPGEAPGAADPGPGGEPPLPGAAGPPPSLLVTVLGPDGEPAESGTVYALGAGEPGTDDDDGVFQASVEGPGPVRLRLPLPGLYDVGFQDGSGATLLTDVRVEPGDGNEAVIRPAPRIPVQVRIEGEWPPRGADQPVLVVDFWTEDDPGQRGFPGRGERGQASGTAILTEAAGESQPLVPGRVYQFHVRVREVRAFIESSDRAARERPLPLDSHRFGFAADRETVRPGETLTVRVVPRAALALTPEVGPGLREAEASKAGGNRQVTVSILRDGREICRASVGTMLHPPPQWAEPSVVLSFDPGTFEVRWSAPGMRSGSRAGISVGAGEMVEVGIPLEYDPSPVPDPVPGEAVAAEELEAPEPDREIHVEGGPAEGEVYLVGESVDGEGRTQVFEHTLFLEGGATRWAAGDAEEWVAAGAILAPYLASEIQPVPAAGPLRFSLRPAGLLCFVPSEVLPREIGEFRIRRADGRPIPMAGDGGRGYDGASREWTIDEDSLLGPFPEGRITFEVRLGGLRLPDVRAEVKAGRIEVVRLSR